MNYLFLASIGPVQSFIASARRTRDLHCGSWLLSELSKAAANEIVRIEERLECLIFPAPTDKSELAGNTKLMVANKIVAWISHSPQEVGPLVKQAIQIRLNTMKTEAFKDMGPVADMEHADAQIEHLIDYVWVAVPFKQGDNYKVARQYLEAALGMRKNTHNFMPVTWGSKQPKSSITGQLESVIPVGLYPKQRQTPQEKTKSIEHLYQSYRAGPAEHLSAIDLVKRRTNIPRSFSSTSHIAAGPYLERLNKLTSEQKEKASAKLDDYKRQARKAAGEPNIEIFDKIYKLLPHSLLSDYDGAIFFEERLLDKVVNKEEVREASRKLDSFFEYIDAHLGHGRPEPYYAILVADGDGMGKVIDRQAEIGMKRHQELSRALDGFAREVSKTAEQHQGSLVYAGGDDVMALLPLHTLLQCAQRLREQYNVAVDKYHNSDGVPSTLSVGIAIVHHLELLQEALNIARAAENRAKSCAGKNALAITISKRSGKAYTLPPVKWDSVPRYIEQPINWYQSGLLSHGTAYELRDLVQRFTLLVSKNDQTELQEVIKQDAWRILRRKLNDWEKKRTEEERKQAQQIANELKGWLALEQNEQQQEKGSKGDDVSAHQEAFSLRVEDLVPALIIAETLADARKLAIPGEERKP